MGSQGWEAAYSHIRFFLADSGELSSKDQAFSLYCSRRSTISTHHHRPRGTLNSTAAAPTVAISRLIVSRLGNLILSLPRTGVEWPYQSRIPAKARISPNGFNISASKPGS